MKYLKLFTTDNDRLSYEDSGNYVEPYVSLVDGDNSVHYNKPKETRVVAKFNVTDTSQPTRIMGWGMQSAYTEIEIDGVVQSNVVSAYTFDTLGEHTVKYTLADPTSIGNHAFSSCSGLTSVTIPSSVTSIGRYAFSECTSLTSVTIGSGVTSIGERAFDYCSGLTSVIIPDSVTSIGERAFGNCSGLNIVTIGSGVTSIGNNAFSDCDSLTSVTIPNSVTSIGSGAFNGCSGLTSVTIPNGVTSISDGTFYGCSSLTRVTIGNSVTSIGYAAFYQCSNLTSVTSLATTAPTITNSTFQGVKTNGTLTVPSGSSGYDVWMGTGDYYLGKYNWTKVEQ